jgi:hypothetical protein
MNWGCYRDGATVVQCWVTQEIQWCPNLGASARLRLRPGSLRNSIKASTQGHGALFNAHALP